MKKTKYKHNMQYKQGFTVQLTTSNRTWKGRRRGWLKLIIFALSWTPGYSINEQYTV